MTMLQSFIEESKFPYIFALRSRSFACLENIIAVLPILTLGLTRKSFLTPKFCDTLAMYPKFIWYLGSTTIILNSMRIPQEPRLNTAMLFMSICATMPGYIDPVLLYTYA